MLVREMLAIRNSNPLDIPAYTRLYVSRTYDPLSHSYYTTLAVITVLIQYSSGRTNGAVVLRYIVRDMGLCERDNTDFISANELDSHAGIRAPASD